MFVVRVLPSIPLLYAKSIQGRFVSWCGHIDKLTVGGGVGGGGRKH